MSTSTDANVAFGVDLENEIPNWLYKFAGLKNDADHEELLEALKPLGLTLYVHCSDNCPMHILALDGTEHWRHKLQKTLLILSKQ